MGFIWFFFMIFTMGSASRFFEHIENKTLRFVTQLIYYIVMATISYAVYIKFGLETY